MQCYFNCIKLKILRRTTPLGLPSCLYGFAITLALVFISLHAAAQNEFSTIFVFNNSNGNGPNSLMQGTDGLYYGTTYSGGAYNCGTIFRIDGAVNTWDLTMSASFDGTNGAAPNGDLIQAADGNFYGTTAGTIFRATRSGIITALYTFNRTISYYSPQSGLAIGPDGLMYGTTKGGPTNGGYGTLFKVSTNGVFTTLTSFNGANGSSPLGQLVFDNDGFFYGTTYSGGAFNYGSVFKSGTNGILTTLVSFNLTNGAYPRAGLTMGADGLLYGTTSGTGLNGNNGTIFCLSKDGIFKTLYSFTTSAAASPFGGLLQSSDGNFYGTTLTGGTNGGYGTVFKITPSGQLTVLFSFNGGTYGGNPRGKLVLGHDGYIYGTAFDYGYTGGVGSGSLYLAYIPSACVPLVYPTIGRSGGVSLTWIPLYSRVYQVQCSVGGIESWQNLSNPISATNSPMTFTDTNALHSASSKFYRVMLSN